MREKILNLCRSTSTNVHRSVLGKAKTDEKDINEPKTLKQELARKTMMGLRKLKGPEVKMAKS